MYCGEEASTLKIVLCIMALSWEALCMCQGQSYLIFCWLRDAKCTFAEKMAEYDSIVVLSRGEAT